MKLSNNLFICAALLLGLSSCEKVMDKTNLSTIDGSLIYSDSTLAFLNLSYIYNDNLPGWFGNTGGAISGSGAFSDESYGESKFFEGTVDQATVADFGTGLSTSNNWAKIRKINEFIRDVNNGDLPQYTKNKLSGEARFFRAFRYFDLVRLYGGVPLVLEPLNPVGAEQKESNFMPRNSTSESIAQIVADLDFAIASLPGRWSSTADWGRITKGAAAAFKGRVLLTWASAQFNPGDLTDRWEAAYNANLQAKKILDDNSFGLNSSYENMWFTEVNNPEAVLITGYNTKTSDQAKKTNTYDNQTRPSYLGSAGGSNQPSWDMVKAYPMKDGKKPGESAYGYSDQLFYKNRDPRFEKTIAYNGSTWAINGDASYRLWTYFAKNSSGTYVTTETKASNTGFYLRKAIDPNISASNVANSGTDWMEIRYAEVLLNLAESAAGFNRLTTSEEAYQGLIAVRRRAGIEPGSDNLFGLDNDMTRPELFDAILYERQIEFAFEGKRFWDLRRTKKIEQVLNGKKRQGLRIELKTGTGIPTPAEFASNRNSVNLDEAYTNYFQLVPEDKDTKYAINWKPEYYFFALPNAAIINNPKLQQNNTWGGTFDPLK
ncbi:RagB/SusD family nutrient uptake outer membrane protein [Desertivirga xinjiangensis]|uniref:RagB/SusD family nutrient uptake outer membrane protein n=1 Tax=Desertivirga xinjiangensis TaxID=539206 RepID=UPI00210DDF58|nr:RagB/SusD family nutrient uptake outer membrane protein [Pedobacter xinjiangensis]